MKRWIYFLIIAILFLISYFLINLGTGRYLQILQDKLPSQTYNFELDFHPRGYITLNNYNYYFKFSSALDMGVLYFKVTNPNLFKEDSLLTLDLPEGVKIQYIEIKNEDNTVTFENGTDYSTHILSEDGKNTRLVIDKFNISSNELNFKIVFNSTNFYPNGRFFFNTIAKKGEIYAERPFISFVLGDYSCYPNCVSNKRQARDEFNIDESERIDIFVENENPTEPGLESIQINEGISYNLNTFNQKNKRCKEFWLSLGIALLAGTFIYILENIEKLFYRYKSK